MNVVSYTVWVNRQRVLVRAGRGWVRVVQSTKKSNTCSESLLKQSPEVGVSEIRLGGVSARQSATTT